MTTTSARTSAAQTEGPSPSQLRVAEPGDFDAILEVDELAFLNDHNPEARELNRSVLEFDRVLIASDRDVPVGITAAYSLTMTVPGGPAVPVAGVTWVGVRPTHRRRGILTRLMHAQLTALHDAGASAGPDGGRGGRGSEAVAALWASELAIYGRYGYGAAARGLSLQIPRNPAALIGAPLDPSLRLRILPAADSVGLVDRVYAAEAGRRPGIPHRDKPIWQRLSVYDPERERDGAAALRCVVAEDDTGVRAYARYATAAKWERGGPAGEVRVRELFGLDAAAEAAVWRFLLDIDLTKSVSVFNRPLDDPLLEWLADVRRAEPSLRDNLFVRLVDVDRALSARRYSVPIDLVLEVADEVCPWNAARWRLAGDTSGASCVRVGDEPDLVLSATELGAVYLGGITLRSLADAGRVEERTPGSVRQATLAFRGELAPWCPFVF